MGVAVMGVGISGAFPASDGLSYRELITRAAKMAYQDAGVEPEELDGAVSVEEDFVSGYSISDEYVPDQLGMVRKPVYTICGEYLQGIASAVMQIQTGRFDMLVVQGYCKASNILLKDEVLHFALDPVFNRLGVSPHYVAGIEMQHFLQESPYGMSAVAEIVTRNRKQALANPLAPYGAKLCAEDVLRARPVAEPLTAAMIARHADASVVMVLGRDDIAIDRARHPVFVTGTGWASASSVLERREMAFSEGTAIAGRMACAEAKVHDVANEIDVFYLSDLYAHRQLMHMEALGLTMDELPFINPDGGTQGCGDLIEATGGMRLYDAVLQLRGEAGAHQIEEVERALVHGWRGVPTDTAAVVILDVERS